MKFWTKRDDDYLKENLNKMTDKEMSKYLGRSETAVQSRRFKLGLFKDKNIVAKRNSGCFKKGLIPWNKGLKGIRMSPETEFKKGNKPFNTKYDGYISIRRDNKSGHNYKYIRISEGIWKEYHRYIWENEFGEIPESHVLRFKNGDTLDCRLENLELISRAEHCRRNYKPPKLTDEYCAFTLTHLSSLNREDVLHHKELIELQRNRLQLKREIQKWQKT